MRNGKCYVKIKQHQSLNQDTQIQETNLNGIFGKFFTLSLVFAHLLVSVSLLLLNHGYIYNEISFGSRKI